MDQSLIPPGGWRMWMACIYHPLSISWISPCTGSALSVDPFTYSGQPHTGHPHTGGPQCHEQVLLLPTHH